LLVMPASRELTGARAWMLYVAAGVEGVVVKHPLGGDRPCVFVPTRTRYPEEPQIRSLGRSTGEAAAGSAAMPHYQPAVFLRERRFGFASTSTAGAATLSVAGDALVRLS